MKLKRKLLVSATCTAMLVQFPAVSTLAQDAASKQSREVVQTLEPVTVTGSLIPQAQAQDEAATPIITITSQDIQRQGFPSLYDRQGNFVDPAGIPTAMVERIEIVPGNQSPIYGSSAITGVVNILPRKHIDGVEMGFRTGSYGSGGSQRFQLTGGNTFGKHDNWAAAVQFRVPTFSMLTANVSGHYDDYKNKGDGVRHDSTPNYLADGHAVDGARKVDALWLFNATYDHAVSDDISLTFTVNNLLDESPPRDDTCTCNDYERSDCSAMAGQTDCYQGKGAGPAHAGPVFLHKGSA